MALVSGRRSTLNPDAPLFIPVALRQVEDFSPEWWQLITTSTWYHDYWVSQHQDEDGFYDNAEAEDEFDVSNIADLLPDTFDLDDLDAGEDFSAIEAQFDEFVMSQHVQSPLPANGLAKDAEALVKNVNLVKSPKWSSMEAVKYAEKAPKNVNQKYSPRRIQQPR